MANTLVLLEKVTVGAAGAAYITFSNIPQTGYNDLVIKFSARSTQTGGYSDDINLNINGTASVLSDKLLYGTGAGVASTGYSAQTNIWVTSAPNSSTTTSTFGNAEFYIPNYNSTTTYKSFSLDGVTENNATNALGSLTAGLYSNNSAITSIKLQLGSGSFVQYSTFSLYGVSNVNTTPLVAPKATGGDIIQTDGTYWYHAFINSGTFTPATALTADVLVVAGGGGGGYFGGGGGGAGGLCYQTGRSILATSNTVTVGAGGAGGSQDGNPGTVGSNSVFDTITSTGGGGGYNAGASLVGGGSGGGAGWQATYAGGVATQGNSGGATGYGNAGGSNTVGSGSPNYTTAGGGGAGAVGGNAVSSSVSGAGGVGLSGTTIAALDAMGAATSTGQLVSSHYYYAGGGGGSNGSTNGAGASGGGANGSNGGRIAATANTGGGGGGGGGAGGSGIVIVRYAI